MREREYQRRIEDMLDRFGWKWRHVPAPMRFDSKRATFVPAAEAAGLCDIIATHHDPPRLLFLEVKGDRGSLSDAQRDFLQSVKAVAEASFGAGEIELDYARSGDTVTRIPRTIGVVAAWPKDEAVIEQMLRTKIMS